MRLPSHMPSPLELPSPSPVQESDDASIDDESSLSPEDEDDTENEEEHEYRLALSKGKGYLSFRVSFKALSKPQSMPDPRGLKSDGKAKATMGVGAPLRQAVSRRSAQALGLALRPLTGWPGAGKGRSAGWLQKPWRHLV